MPVKLKVMAAILACLLLSGCAAVPDKGAQEALSAAGTAMGLASAPTVEEAAWAVSTPAPTFTPTPEPTDTPVPTPTPTPEPTPSPEPKPTPFTLAWISDTQAMARHYPEELQQMAEYLVGQQQEQNIVAAVHTGDVVDSCGTLWQWENVSPPLLTIMEHIPLSILAGNHDLARERKGNKQYDLFAKREVIQRSWEGAEVYQRGEATCRLFTAGGTDFILVTLGFNNTPGARRWVKATLDENADRVAIIGIHSALEKDGTFSADGNRLIWDVVSQCPNVRLVVCGHNRGAIHRVDGYDDDGDGEPDRTVATMMCNFQDDQEAGLGYIRLLRFEPEDRSLHVRTYSPVYDLNTYEKVSDDEMTFVLENAY